MQSRVLTSAIGLAVSAALLLGGMSGAVAQFRDAPNPFAPKPIDPFKQPGLPLPPPSAPVDRGKPVRPGEATQATPDSGKPPVANLPSVAGPDGREPSEDEIYAVYQRGFFIETFALAIDKAGKGSAAAMTMVGHLYESGQGVRQDSVKAASWYGLAAERGDREAQVALGLLSLAGVGVAKDKKRALELFTQAADQNQPTALFNLAILLIEGDVVLSDPLKARALMHRAAELGNVEAAYSYAVMLEESEDPGTDEEVTRWLSEAAKAGHVAAEVELAIRLVNGRGAEKDFALAAKYLTRAAWAGNPVGQNRLAYLTIAGIGVPSDPVEAAKWHLLAKAGGLPDVRLDELVASLSPADVEKAKTLAARWSDLPVAPSLTPMRFVGRAEGEAVPQIRGSFDRNSTDPSARLPAKATKPPKAP